MEKNHLLTTKNFTNLLLDYSSNCQSETIFFSPFIKLNALKYITSNLKNDVKVKIITKLSIREILDKVSDFEICQYALDKNWSIGLIENLHAKMYIFDQSEILVGSNNMTSYGLGLDGEGNAELGVNFSPDLKTYDVINTLVRDVNWLDQNKVNLMKETLENIKVNNTSTIDQQDWPQEIYTQSKEFLLLSTNLPDITPQLHQKGERSFFVSDFLNKEKTKEEFLNSEVYLWLKTILKTDEFKSFGWLTSKIHNCILDRPLPYRSRIKSYCENLFLWVEYYSDDISIIKYNKTKSLELVS